MARFVMKTASFALGPKSHPAVTLLANIAVNRSNRRPMCIIREGLSPRR
jgi:hypothetical protein